MAGGHVIGIMTARKIPYPGALWRRIEYFAEYLSRRGFRVYVTGAWVLSRGLFRHTAMRPVKSSAPFRILNAQFRIRRMNWFTCMLNFFGALPVVALYMLLRPAVVLVSVPSIDILPAGYLAARAAGAKLVVDVRDPMEYRVKVSSGLTRLFFQFLVTLNYSLLRKADLVVTVTGVLAKLLARHGVRAYVVRNGADTSVFRPCPRASVRNELGLRDDEVALVFSGHLGSYYDVLPLLRALAHLPEDTRRRVKLVLLGGFTSEYVKKLLTFMKLKDLPNCLRILPLTYDARRVAEVLSACDVGLVARVEDEFFDYAIPVKLYEYIACGLPVLVLARKGSLLWDTVQKWGVGYACPSSDTGCIANALLRLLDAEELRRLKNRSLELRSLVDREAAARKLQRLLLEILRGSEDY